MKTKFNKKDAGYNMWLGSSAGNGGADVLSPFFFSSLCVYSSNTDPLLTTAKDELVSAIKSMYNKTLHIINSPAAKGTVLLYVIDETCIGNSVVSEEERKLLGKEGFLIKHCEHASAKCLLIAGRSGAGVLYGIFALLRLLRCRSFTNNTHILDNPAIALRMLNHWDNMDGSIERGYAGRSIFFENGGFVSDLSRINDYARFMASVGLNGIVINNVNVQRTETRLITKEFFPDLARVVDLFGRYGIKTYLSINYSSPMELGGLETADPLDGQVQAWWNKKAEEIYRFIPDFGGFMVKADSEFRPGPFTYGRNHAEGANMLAAALKPYGGLVIWRCFVYDCMQDWRDRVTDRANAAYDNFMPLDGAFSDNVLLQIKNGPMDFQVREPVSPLFGGLQKSNIIMEFQITQEYTGQQRHLCYLAPMWRDVLDFDTFAKGKETTVKRLLSKQRSDGTMSGIAAVSNIGSDLNWTGHDLAQANLYCFGRLAWNPELSSERIASEWVSQTFGTDPFVLDTICGMLLDSYHIYESYTSPLGIGWMVTPGIHYGPSVDGYEYSAWGTYHRSDCYGIGVDRSVASGTGNAGRYIGPNAVMYEKPETCPEELLLFFHHIPYNFKLKSGVTLIQHIYDSHFDGADQASLLIQRWKTLEGRIEPNCFDRVLKRLEIQAKSAREWRDVINTYFYRKSGVGDEKSRVIY